MKNTDSIEKMIADESKEHSSIPFWSWNDKLDVKMLGEQINDMKALGMRGFFMHARAGLETEYLSDEWFDSVRYCVGEAKKLGMEAWAYDENGWPSGFGGGELLKDEQNQACGLVVNMSDKFPSFDENILGVYTVSQSGAERRECDCGASEYVVIRRKRDFSYVDTMNPSVTEKFLAYTHERYKRELGDSFGKEMPGFFTDEPQYFRYGTPWSDTFLKTFKKKYGYDVLDMLPAMFFDYEGAEAQRYDYYLLCHESFYNGFMKPVYDWCSENGVKLTGHGIEEWSISGQMACCAGVMPFYMYQHIPGIDYLRRDVRNINGARQLGSVCEQTGKKVRLTESFACCGWDVSPRELKRIAELQFAGGANLLCEHLYAYSERGQRKRDYPNHYSEHNTWHKYYGEFVKHFANLGAALSQGKEIADTLVIQPMRSAYLHYKRSLKAASIATLDNDYNRFVEKISKDHIPFHFGDEGIMESIGSVEGNRIRIGECLYDSVILPYCETLTANTVKLIDEYISNGGKLCIVGDKPSRIDGRLSENMPQANITYDEIAAGVCIKIKNNIPLHMQIRNIGGDKLLFLANTSSDTYNDVEITVEACRGLEELDIDTLERKPVRGKRNNDGSVTVMYSFGDSQSCLLIESDTKMLDTVCDAEKRYMELGEKFELVGERENMLTLDSAQISKDGNGFSKVRPIVRIKDNLLREKYEGKLILRYSFKTDFIPAKLLLVVEPMKYSSVCINGNNILPCGETRIDKRFCAYNIAPFAVNGENTIDMELDYFQSEEVYRVLYGGGNEALRNCLCFDTEIEAVYLFGDFRVVSDSIFESCERNNLRTDGNFYLCQMKKSIDLKNIVCDGYPFFAGELEAETVLMFEEGMPTVLKLGGRFAVCGININGTKLNCGIFDDEFELKPYLKNGENVLRIKICLSNRNLLGPHHGINPEPTSVVPTTFSYESMWDGDKCSEYIPSYAFVKFGIGF